MRPGKASQPAGLSFAAGADVLSVLVSNKGGKIWCGPIARAPAVAAQRRKAKHGRACVEERPERDCAKREKRLSGRDRPEVGAAGGSKWRKDLQCRHGLKAGGAFGNWGFSVSVTT
jgi:hypothetical protein